PARKLDQPVVPAQKPAEVPFIAPMPPVAERTNGTLLPPPIVKSGSLPPLVPTMRNGSMSPPAPSVKSGPLTSAPARVSGPLPGRVSGPLSAPEVVQPPLTPAPSIPTAPPVQSRSAVQAP